MLRGAGVAMGLPFLEAMLPRLASAQAVSGQPLRLLSWFFPNGYYRTSSGIDDWTPKGSGTSYQLGPIMASLAPFQNDIQILTNVSNPPGKASSVANLHAVGTGSFLTCLPINNTTTPGGISMDQVAAKQLGRYTRFPSLQVGTNAIGGEIPVESTISWADGQTPLACETQPARLFDRLFAGPDSMLSSAEIAKRKLYRKSILDSVNGSANTLKGKLGAGDQAKLEGYLEGVRELELRIASQPTTPPAPPGARPPLTGDLKTQVRLMLDVLTMAMQTDATRVATFLFEKGASDIPYPFLMANGAPINSGHHSVSHHHGAPSNIAILKSILTWHVEQLAYFLNKLKTTDEGGVSLLSRTCLFYSSEIGDGDLHEQEHLPIIVAGGAGGALKPGKHIIYTSQASKADLFITLMRSVGVDVAKFGGDGDVALSGLT